MDILYPLLRTLLICLAGLLIAFLGRRRGLTIFSLSGRLNRLQFFILCIALMLVLYGIDRLESRLIAYIVTLPAYWTVKIGIDLLHAAVFPLSCVLFGRRIHDIGFNAWAGILWSAIIIFINTYSAVTPVNYLLDLLVWLIVFLFWILPGQPEPNQYGAPPFMPVHSPPSTRREQDIQDILHRGSVPPHADQGLAASAVQKYAANRPVGIKARKKSPQKRRKKK